MIGKTLCHYQITNKLGKGGMGEVFQAKDQKLGRDVAIKVLPDEFARDADRVARFQREAKLLASLNHANIAAIYGLEESSGTNFLVLELVEGETLADRIKQGPIPVEESLKLALQIAEALEAAHEKGVIHRDLKPANIKVTPEGKVKVLDFGLAKAFAGDQEANLSNSPTLSNLATQQGVILGTAAYMSPEQAKGKTVDRRADIWAFGCVLYEMLTGHIAFRGEDVSEILASVIKGDVNLDLLPANIHPRVREAIVRCLQRDLNRRYQDIREAKYEIEQALTDPGGVRFQPAAVEPRRRPGTILPWIAASLVVGAVITAIAGWIFRHATVTPRVTRFSIELAGEHSPWLGAIALSPDGSRFVYPANDQLYVQYLDQMEPAPIPGTKEGSDPYFSPDGESIAFSTPTQLKTVSLTGVAPVVVAQVGAKGGEGQALVGAWDSQNRIFFGQGGAYGLSQIPAGGGVPEPFAKLGDHKDLDYPDVLPGGEWVIFTDKANDGNWSSANIVAQSTKTGERKLLLKGGYFARYAPTGHLVYAQSGALFAVRFNADKVEVTGKPVQLVQNVAVNETSGHAQFAIAANGTLVYVPGLSAAGGSTLVWVDRGGKEELLSIEPKDIRSPRISPDGTKVASTVMDAAKSDIWIWDVVRKNMTRLTFNENSRGPLWTADGKRIVFLSGSTNKSAVYWRPADGTGKDELLASVPNQITIPWAWSSDNRILVTMDFVKDGFNIGSLSMEGEHSYKALLQDKGTEFQPKISADGRWIAYTSDESGEAEIYVRPFPDIEKGKDKISLSGGNSPLWSPDGDELFYRNKDEVIRVPVQTKPAFKPGKPETIFRGDYTPLWNQDGHTWDISPDGKRFLMMKWGARADDKKAGPAVPKINVVLNWTEELKQRVPVK